MSQEPDIIARKHGAWGRITLNRPKALHALTTDMCLAFAQALEVWRDDPEVHAILVDHSGERGFCAGGDIRMLAESGRADGALGRAFFAAEYRLNRLIKTYPKFYVALIDGITMGGGVGISVHGDARVASERTVFAMPETAIGLIPDVGGGWFLPRLEGELGAWLGLTGARLKGPDALSAGIATHFCPGEKVEALKSALLAETPEADAAFVFGRILADFHEAPIGETLRAQRPLIDRLFAGDELAAIFEHLAQDPSDWAKTQLEGLKSKSPFSMMLTLKHLRTGGRLNRFEEVQAMEYRLASRAIATHDFQEGVRALILDKDNSPNWRPSRIEDVAQADIDAMFEPLAGENDVFAGR